MNKDLALMTKPLQARESFPAAKGTPLGQVQVADELGLAYLEGDIDFGAIGRNEIYQNVRFIILTEYFSVPLDREFGMDYSMVDRPMRIAEAVLAQEVAMKIALYEPRAQFREINYEEDMLNGKLSPTVKIALITDKEGPSLYKPTLEGAAVVEPTTKATIASGEAFTGVITGLQGRPGDAGSIIVGQTITGVPGAPASVVNVGTPSIAVLDFTIPEGLKGDPGAGIIIKGTVANHNALPISGNVQGDMWITADTGHGWSWNGTTWIDIGPIQGPKGDTGITGATGQQGATGATGPKGDVGQVWRGSWNALTTYNINDAIEYQGSTYICIGSNINDPPAPVGGTYWAPPLANTTSRGTVPQLSPSAQATYVLRGDNTWSVFADLAAALIPVAVGTVVQAKAYTIQDGGSTSAQATVYGFTSTQGTQWGSYSFTPKFANSLLRISFSCEAQIGGAAGWYGFALFKDAETTARCQAWSYHTTVGAGNCFCGSDFLTLASNAAITFQFRGGLGQAGGSTVTTKGRGAVFIDEVKQ